MLKAAFSRQAWICPIGIMIHSHYPHGTFSFSYFWMLTPLIVKCHIQPLFQTELHFYRYIYIQYILIIPLSGFRFSSVHSCVVSHSLVNLMELLQRKYSLQYIFHTIYVHDIIFGIFNLHKSADRCWAYNQRGTALPLAHRHEQNLLQAAVQVSAPHMKFTITEGCRATGTRE